MSEPDNKTKSIVMLVRVLLAACAVIVVLVVLVMYLWSRSNTNKDDVAGQPKPFICGNAYETTDYRIGSSDGKQLFKTNCSSCHSVNDAKCGNVLRGVLDRVPSGGWKYGFIRNEDSMIKIKDSYTVARRSEFGIIKPSHAYSAWSNNDIDAVLMYANK